MFSFHLSSSFSFLEIIYFYDSYIRDWSPAGDVPTMQRSPHEATSAALHLTQHVRFHSSNNHAAANHIVSRRNSNLAMSFYRMEWSLSELQEWNMWCARKVVSSSAFNEVMQQVFKQTFISSLFTKIHVRAGRAQWGNLLSSCMRSSYTNRQKKGDTNVE